jgi:hypothetical protein
MKDIKIQSLGITGGVDGAINLIMLEGTMPNDCVVVFIKKEDYPELLRRLKEVCNNG